MTNVVPPAVSTDSEAPHRRLSPSAAGALRCWLDAERRQPASPAELKRAMRLLALVGRRQQLHVEQVIVAIKEAWATLPPLPAGDPSPRGAREVLDRVVTACIDEFYALKGSES